MYTFSKKAPVTAIAQMAALPRDVVSTITTRKLKQGNELIDQPCRLCLDHFRKTQLVSWVNHGARQNFIKHVFHYNCLRKVRSAIDQPNHNLCPTCKGKMIPFIDENEFQPLDARSPQNIIQNFPNIDNIIRRLEQYGLARRDRRQRQNRPINNAPLVNQGVQALGGPQQNPPQNHRAERRGNNDRGARRRINFGNIDAQDNHQNDMV